MSHQQKSRSARYEKRNQTRSVRRKVNELLDEVRRTGEIHHLNQFEDEELVKAS